MFQSGSIRPASGAVGQISARLLSGAWMLLILLAPAHAGAATFTVNSEGDEPDGGGDSVCDTGNEEDGFTGVCTLRAALQNAQAGDLITFEGGVQSIAPATLLPVLRGSIDGGASRVEITGELLPGGDGIRVSGNVDGESIRSLVINRFPGAGIELFGQFDFVPDNFLIEGCYIGTDRLGSANPDYGNGGPGIAIVGANFPTIRNCVISGNDGDGIAMNIGNTGGPNEGLFVEGCMIGTDSTGSTALANGGSGIVLGNAFFGPMNNTIGSLLLPNVISGNRFYGIEAQASDFGGGDDIVGNFIGTNLDGTAALPNGKSGILIGGELDAEFIGPFNVISGNAEHGIFINGTATSDHEIFSNSIGVDFTGAIPIGNGGAGIFIQRSLNNLIGGTDVTPGACDGSCNFIAHNQGAGVVLMQQAAQTSIRGNAIFENGGPGIDLNNDGPTLNDGLQDSDEGGNRLLNYPVLTSVVPANGMTLVEGVRTTNFNTPHYVDFYGNDNCDASGFGEGRVYLGTLTLQFADPTFSIMLPGEYEAVTATFTDLVNQPSIPGSTSEFSPCGEVFTVNSVADAGDVNQGDGVCSTGVMIPDGRFECTLRAVIQEANVFDGPQVVLFDIPGAAPYRILVGANLPIITQPLALNAASQPGYAAGSPVVEVDGQDIEAPQRRGFTVQAEDCSIRGFSIMNFLEAGIGLFHAQGGSVVEANIIGTDAAGAAGLGNGTYGIVIQDSPRNLIGGLGANARNVIAQNGFSSTSGGGIAILRAASEGNRVLGNYIGLDRTGALDLGNGFGVSVEGAFACEIGSAAPGGRNVISGNGDGIRVQSFGFDSPQATRIQGNWIGLNAAGAAAVPNSGNGIELADAPNALIGGNTPTPGTGAGNIIAGSGRNGIRSLTAGVEIEGNIIGTNAAGAAGLGNTLNGVLIQGSISAVGGDKDDEKNVISGNLENGVKIAGENVLFNDVLGNWIGVSPTGFGALPNALYGVEISGGASQTAIGGDANDDRNVISGNTLGGVLLKGVPGQDSTLTGGNFVVGNFIGTTTAGTAALANGAGVRIENSPNNVVGGLAPDSSNIVSGNASDGMLILGDAATGNVIQGNLIGADAAGIATIPNLGDGIEIYGARMNRIGGAGLLGNLISSNGGLAGEGRGILIDGRAGTGQDSAGNIVEGNIIGLSVAGLNLGNLSHGVAIDDSGGNTIGPGNVIESNAGDGVRILHLGQAYGNRIASNSIFNNTGLGIDLEGDGVTMNDGLDPDDGANRYQNFPELTAFGSPAASLKGVLDSTPLTPFEIDLFTNSVGDSSAHGEGEVFLMTVSVVTNAQGAATFFLRLPNAPLSDCLSAVARNAITGDTSEFSLCAPIEPPPANGVDFGDAPATFATLVADDGARHLVVPGFSLGAGIDAESDGQPSDDAMDDDALGADEDGVEFLDEIAFDFPPNEARVTASQAGLLDAWIDFNHDGDFLDFAEQIFASRALGAGQTTLDIPIPAFALDGPTYARFRLSTAGGLAPTGPAEDGEVEDYQVTVFGKNSAGAAWMLFE